MFLEFPYLVDAPVGCPVYFDNVQVVPRCNGDTLGAFCAWFPILPSVGTIQGLGNYPGKGGLTTPSWSGKEIGVAVFPTGYLPSKQAYSRILGYYL